MKMTKTMTLEEQIAALQSQIDFLKTGGMTTSPVKRLQAIRRACRTVYFGTWNDMKEGKAGYGPEEKKYADYNTIRDIVARMTDLLFRYSRGLSNGGTLIVKLVRSEEDIKDYERICNKVCHEIKEMISEESKNR